MRVPSGKCRVDGELSLERNESRFGFLRYIFRIPLLP